MALPVSRATAGSGEKQNPIFRRRRAHNLFDATGPPKRRTGRRRGEVVAIGRDSKRRRKKQDARTMFFSEIFFFFFYHNRVPARHSNHLVPVGFFHFSVP